jgi:hypothetical protein
VRFKSGSDRRFISVVKWELLFGFGDHRRRTYAGSERIHESELIRWVILLRQPGDDISLCWTKLHYFDGLK